MKLFAPVILKPRSTVLRDDAVAEIHDVIDDGREAGRLAVGDLGIGGGQDDLADRFERDAVVPRVEPDQRLAARRRAIGAGVDERPSCWPDRARPPRARPGCCRPDGRGTCPPSHRGRCRRRRSGSRPFPATRGCDTAAHSRRASVAGRHGGYRGGGACSFAGRWSRLGARSRRCTVPQSGLVLTPSIGKCMISAWPSRRSPLISQRTRPWRGASATVSRFRM